MLTRCILIFVRVTLTWLVLFEVGPVDKDRIMEGSKSESRKSQDASESDS